MVSVHRISGDSLRDADFLFYSIVPPTKEFRRFVMKPSRGARIHASLYYIVGLYTSGNGLVVSPSLVR